jgi:HEPN domain-containing protein
VSLQDWLKSHWLIEHQTSRQEILDLLSVADRDLAQCQTPHLSPDWQLNIAYNAALQAATAALAASGYRAAREAHHYRVIQSLAHTIKADPGLITQLDKFRKKRNITGYERAGVVSEQEAKEMFALAKNLRDKVEKWLRSNFPELL